MAPVRPLHLRRRKRDPGRAVGWRALLDPNGTPTDNGFAHAFDGGVLVGAQGRVTVKPFGLTGHLFVTADLQIVELG